MEIIGMKNLYLMAGLLSLVLVMGIFFAGCVQHAGTSPVQSTSTTPSSVQTAGQSSSEVPTESPGMVATNGSGQSALSSQTGTPIKNYEVLVNVTRFGSGITFTYLGGPDAASLQSITILQNGDFEARLITGTHQSALPVGTKAVFRVEDTTGATNHIVAYGEYTGGISQVILDTTI